MGPIPITRSNSREERRRGLVHQLNIAVAGCGPAGLAAALVLSRSRHRVTLFEQFDHPRPIGSGIMLQPTGLAVLDELGLAALIRSLGCRIDRMFGVSAPSRKRVLDVNYHALGPDYHGVAVHRTALFQVLFDAVCEADVPLCTDTRIVGLKRGVSGLPSLTDSQDITHGPFDLVVDASGASSNLLDYADNVPQRSFHAYGAIWASLDWPGDPFSDNALEQRYHRASTMVGVLPIGRYPGMETPQAAFFWSMKWREYDEWRSRGLEPWKNRVAELWPETVVLLDQIVDSDQFTLARYGQHTLSTPYTNRIVFIGDAAHASSPQLGQGANMALLDAWALGRALGRNGDLESALRDYASMRRLHVWFFQSASRMFTPFYQSDSGILAKLRDTFFDPLTRLPVARRMVAGLISGTITNPLPRIGIDSRRTGEVSAHE